MHAKADKRTSTLGTDFFAFTNLICQKDLKDSICLRCGTDGADWT